MRAQRTTHVTADGDTPLTPNVEVPRATLALNRGMVHAGVEHQFLLTSPLETSQDKRDESPRQSLRCKQAGDSPRRWIWRATQACGEQPVYVCISRGTTLRHSLESMGMCARVGFQPHLSIFAFDAEPRVASYIRDLARAGKV